jgi:hypothetical protein
MKVKTPSLTIPSITIRIEIILLLLATILFTTCFTFQSCCKVGWVEGFEGLKDGVQEIKEKISVQEGENKEEEDNGKE